MFAVRQLCEKYLANGNYTFWMFMDLQKPFNKICQHGMWQMIRVDGDGGKLFKAGKNFYVDV